jgi:hypothetical protein
MSLQTCGHGSIVAPDWRPPPPLSQLSLSLTLVPADQRIGGNVVRQLRLRAAIEFGDDRIGQSLAQFNAPLVETVDRPDGVLDEDAVLLQRDQAAKGRWIEGFSQDHVGRAVALGEAKWCLVVGRAFRFQLILRLAEGQRLGLREQIGHQKVVLLDKRTERPTEANHVAGDQLRALVQELIERVLVVGAGLPPDDRAALIVDRTTL